MVQGVEVGRLPAHSSPASSLGRHPLLFQGKTEERWSSWEKKRRKKGLSEKEMKEERRRKGEGVLCKRFKVILFKNIVFMIKNLPSYP